MEIFTKHGIQYNKNIISELYFKFTLEDILLLEILNKKKN